ncbi:hypothetical protein [Pseudomonas sp. BGI-2]|uniref:hypothetical protein n=1 Tax=Pseudomonas sp. BGI-2 TaxID=2528211 RepID=UPI0010347B61|nr:hypothetical protein [Pseudomonas sp. BGI-2]TBN47106.1 hypothetical protein EYC95_10475 [Pseudomonas sp. BGI-2]
MDIQSAALNQLFVLFPVIIPGWITPVRPAGIAAGGIPHSIYDDQPRGLECLVDPWTEPLMAVTAVDDRVDLYIEGVAASVDGKTISPGEELLRVRLYVPRGRLRDGINRIFYRVTRPSGSFEDSRILEVLYHLRAPGAPAPTNTRLQIPADVRSNGVDAERARQGVMFGFDYSNRRAFDLIRLTLGVVQVEREVTPAEAGPGLPVVTQTLFTDTFSQSGDDAQTAVEYSVTDQLGNFNQSATEYIDVRVSRITLAMAILREIPTENNDDPNTVDLGKLNGGPLWALIHLIESIWNVGDDIRLSFTALLNGRPVATHEQTLRITQTPGQIAWDISNSKVIADSTVMVTYEQIRAGTVIATSTTAEAKVIGKAIDEKPVIIKAEDSKGVVIPNGETTFDTTVMLTGSASMGQKVKIFDGPTPMDEATADLTSGIWTKWFTGLSVAAHSFTAQALYGTGQTSAAHTLIVIAEVAPTISSVKDSKEVEILHGGPTVDTRVTLTGTARKGQKVQVLDGGTDRGEATADPVTGIWKRELSGLIIGGHTYTAKALYGMELVSNARSLVRYAPLQPPSITGVYANGVRILPGGTLRTPATIHFTGTCSPGPQGYAYFWFNGVRNNGWVVNISTNGTVWTSNSVFVQFFAGGQPIPQAITLLDDRIGHSLRSPTYTFTPTYTP